MRGMLEAALIAAGSGRPNDSYPFLERLTSAELFNSSIMAWQETGSLALPREAFQMLLLRDGTGEPMFQTILVV